MIRVFVSASLIWAFLQAAPAQQAEPLPSFEVAAIKPAAPMAPGRMIIGINGGPGSSDPVQMRCTNVSLGDLAQYAYEVKSYQVSGPQWLESTRFDISAKVPAGATKQQSRLMMQNLLAERFKLVLHHSTKEASIYALLVAKNGPKLKESVEDPNTPPPPAGAPVDHGPPVMGKDGFPQLPPGAGRRGPIMMMVPGGRMRMIANGTTIAAFADTLGGQLDRPVTDMTDIKGKYDITLDFAPDPAIMQAKMAAMGVGPPPGMALDGGGRGPGEQDTGNTATVFTALPEQLGLRLEARKGPVDLLVIDSAQKVPTEN